MLRMMEDLDLAYRIGDLRDSAAVAVVVDALPESRPSDVDEQWRERADRPGMREAAAVYRLASRDVDIVTRFIVREHRFTTGLQWRHGALLHDRDPARPAWALIERDDLEDPTVTLRVVGTHPARFRSLLGEAVDTLVEERYAGSVFGPGPLHPGAGPGDGDAVDPIDAERLAVLDGIRVMTEQRAGFAAYCPALFGVRRSFSDYAPKSHVLRLWCEWPSGPHPLRRGAGKYRVGPYSRSTLADYVPYLRCLIETLRLTEYGPGRRSAISIMRRIDRHWRTPDWEPTNDLRTVRAGDFADLRRLFRTSGPAHGASWDGLTAVRRPEDRRFVYLCPEHVAEFEYPYGSTGGARS
jgi:hypothetical protein